MTIKILTGYEAIAAAQENPDLVLYKHTETNRPARADLTLDEALAIAAENPRLVWCTLELNT